MTLDDLDRHVAAAGDFGRAAVPTGFYLAWCANLDLFAADFRERWAEPLLRVKVREISGAELFTGACGGCFEATQLNARGAAFSADYYPRYFDDLVELFADQGIGDPYHIPDNWHSYDQIARLLTAKLLGPPARTGAVPWWQFWRRGGTRR